VPYDFFKFVFCVCTFFVCFVCVCVCVCVVFVCLLNVLMEYVHSNNKASIQAKGQAAKDGQLFAVPKSFVKQTLNYLL